MNDARELCARLNADAASIAAYLLPRGRKVGRDWCAGSTHGEEGGSLKVCIEGQKIGKWSDFADGSAHGDMLDLWMAVKNCSAAEALRQVREHYGVAAPTFTKPKKQKPFVRPKPPANVRPVGLNDDVMFYLRDKRCLFPETIKAWGVATGDLMTGTTAEGKSYSIKGPWMVFPFLKPIDGKMTLVNVKWTHIKKDEKGKKRTRQERDAEPCAFGWHLVPPRARKLVITEGEIDAMTWWQAIREAGVSDQWGVISPPAGAGSGDKQQWIDYDWPLLEQFDDVVLAMDMDKEGDLAVAEIAQRLGLYRVRRASTPLKDANECLTDMQLSSEQFMQILDTARDISPETLRSAAAFLDVVLEQFYPTRREATGIRMPFGKMDKFRLLPGEVTVMTGLSGHGKSALISQIVLHSVDSGEKACVASMEMRPAMTLERMTRQGTRKQKPDPGEIERFLSWLDIRLWLYNVLGSTKTEPLIDAMLYARRRFGCSIFVIDSLMRCGIKVDDLEGQDDFVKRLCAFAEAEYCHVVLIAHSKKPEDESAPVGKLSIKGSGGITDNAYNTLSLWRNKAKENAMQDIEQMTGHARDAKLANWIEKPDAKFICDKQRNNGGWEGYVPLWFDRATCLYRDSRAADLPKLQTFIPDGPIGAAPEDLSFLSPEPEFIN